MGLVDQESSAEAEVGMQVPQHLGYATVGELLHPVGHVGAAEPADLLPDRLDGRLPVPRQFLDHGRQLAGRIVVQRLQHGWERLALADLIELGPDQGRGAGGDPGQFIGQHTPRLGRGWNRKAGR